MQYTHKGAFFLALCLLLSLAGCAAKGTPSATSPANESAQTTESATATEKPLSVTPFENYPGIEYMTLCTLDLIKPADGPILSKYGMRRHPTKKRQRFHNGIDIAAKRGSDVVAAAPGTVVFTGRRTGYGKTVEITHGSGIVTRYAHLDKIMVTKGQAVSPETTLGLVGRTGRTTGPNLHFELLAQGKSINPIPVQGWKNTEDDNSTKS